MKKLLMLFFLFTNLSSDNLTFNLLADEVKNDNYELLYKRFLAGVFLEKQEWLDFYDLVVKRKEFHVLKFSEPIDWKSLKKILAGMGLAAGISFYILCSKQFSETVKNYALGSYAAIEIACSVKFIKILLQSSTFKSKVALIELKRIERILQARLNFLKK